jgi:hypothetical protein
VRFFVSALIFAVLTVAVSAQGRPLEMAARVRGSAGWGERPEARAIAEMLRGPSGRERRWMQRPHLVIVTSVLAFQEGAHAHFTAVDAELTPDEARQLAANMTEGLTVLSGGAFNRFATVRYEQAVPGRAVRVVRTGEIVAGRFRGVREALEAVGYGGRTARADGTITSGTVMLDEDYDRDDERHRLLRIHELGHALGYNHVASERSVMNPTIGAEPTPFDRRVARIAFAHLITHRASSSLIARAARP